jgi:hypothetical protein
LNAERSAHWSKRAESTKEWREAFYWLAKEAHIPPLAAVHLEVRVGYAKGKPVDVANHLPSVKAAQDSLVDCGIIKDDSPTYVKSILFWAPEKTGNDFLTLIVKEA